jgi:N-acetyllactosaminide beta-1,3-N-acetylglucosaminyltransferase
LALVVVALFLAGLWGVHTSLSIGTGQPIDLLHELSAVSFTLGRRGGDWVAVFPAAVADSNHAELVTAASHCSVDHVLQAAKLAQAWRGPVSLAVFVPLSELDEAVRRLHMLRRCHTNAMRFLTLALVLPAGQASASTTRALIRTALHTEYGHATCTATASRHANYAHQQFPYPNNKLRNIAVEQASTPFVLVIDADIIPFPSTIRTDFAAMWQAHLDQPLRQVFVLPAFEVDVMI